MLLLLRRMSALWQLLVCFAITGTSASDTCAATFNPTVHVSTLKKDDINPALYNFSFDLANSMLKLTFTEVVNTSSLSIQSILLQRDADSTNSPSVQLKSETQVGVTTGANRIVSILLGIVSLNKIKFYFPMGSSVSSTFISFSSEVIRDMSGNEAVTILSTQGKPATAVSPDLQGPELSYFDINMSSAVLTIYFSETVNVSSLLIGALRLQGNFNISGENYTLTSAIILTASNHDIISIKISDHDMNEIKALTRMFNQSTNAFLHLSAGGVADMSGNSFNSTYFVVEVSSFYGDFVSPYLNSFSLNMSSGELLLTFSETVNPLTVSGTPFELLLAANSSIYVRLSQFSVHNNLSPIISLMINVSNLHSIKLFDNLCTSNFTTFLALDYAGVKDMNKNGVISILANSPMSVSIFTADAVSPTLDSFSIDMDTGKLRVTFSEPVRVSSLNISGFVLQDSVVPTIEFRLASSYAITGNALKFTINISASDMDGIKLQNIATVKANTYLRLSAGTINDMSGNTVQTIDPSQALNVNNDFIPIIQGPVLLWFDMNIDLSTVTMHFTESVNGSAFKPQSLYLQSKANSSVGLVVQYQFLDGEVTTLSPNYSKILTFKFSQKDSDLIKSLQSLGTKQSNTFLYFSSDLTSDLADVSVSPILSTAAQQVNVFMVDVSSPVLQNSTLDLLSEFLILTFSETVNISSLNLDAITLQNTANSPTISFSVTASSITSFANTPVINISLSKTLLYSLQGQQYIATQPDNSFITFNSSALRDMAGNSLQTTTTSIGTVLRDTIKPTVVSFTLNMNIGVLLITFSKTVNVSATVSTGITLQDKATSDLGNYTLVGPTTVTSGNSLNTVVNIVLNATDVYNIKTQYMCSNSSTSFLIFDAATFTDMSGNSVVAVPNGQALGANGFTGDSVSPSLESFDLLDFDTSLIKLVFSEPVDSIMIDVTKINLSRFFNLAGTFFLTGGVVKPGRTAYHEITLIEADLNILKRLGSSISTPLCTAKENCNVLLASSFAKDIAGNAIVPITTLSGFSTKTQVVTLNRDTVGPYATSFTLNVNTGAVSIAMNEPVNLPSTLVLPDLKLELWDTAESSATTQKIPLRGPTTMTISADALNVSFVITAADILLIKAQTMLGKSISSSFISLITNGFLADKNGNDAFAMPGLSPTPAVLNFSSVQCVSYVRDTTNPLFFEFSLLDMNSGELTLSFNEPVNLSSVDFTKISLQNGLNRTMLSADFYTLTSRGQVSYDDETTKTKIVLTLAQSDLEAIKLKITLAIGVSSSWITIGENVISDMGGNPLIKAVPATAAMRVKSFTSSARSILKSYIFNRNDGTISMNFSGVMTSSTLDATRLTIRSKGSSAPLSYTLTASSGTASSSGFRIVVTLSPYDLNAIKSIRGLATNLSTTYVSILSEFLDDISDVPVTAITANTAQQASAFIADTTNPMLVSFNFTLDPAELVLSFSEMVDLRTLNIGGITLQDAASTSTLNLTLGAATYAPQDVSLTVSIKPLDSSSNELKSIFNLCRSKATTWLSLTNLTLNDLSGNSISSIYSSQAQQVDNFFADTVKPVFLSFELNLHLEVLKLTFSETMMPGSVVPVKLQLQNTNDSTINVIVLQGGNATSLSYTVLSFQLTVTDLNLLKSNINIATGTTNTFLSMAAGAATDTSNNSNIASVRMTSFFTADDISPQLTSFNLDMNNLILQLSFSETVNASSLMTSGITLQLAQYSVLNATAVYYSLTSSAVIWSLGPVVNISIAIVDANGIKIRKPLATSKASSFISLLGGAVKDMNMNAVVSISSSTAMNVASFTSNLVRPILLAFSVNLNASTAINASSELTLNFDTPVDVTTINFTAIILCGLNGTTYRLTDGYTNSLDGLQIIVGIKDIDRNNIKQNENLFVDLVSSRLALDASLIKDLNGNLVVNISVTIPLSASLFVLDNIRPQVMSFNLNINSGMLSITFDETVRISTIVLTHLTLQSTSNAMATSAVTLSSSSVVQTGSVNSISFIIFVSHYDLNQLKLAKIGLDVDSTWLTLNSLFVSNMVGLYVVERLNGVNALQVSTLTKDTVQPVMESFNISLDSGLLSMQFSEPVQHLYVIIDAISLQSTSDSGSVGFKGYTLSSLSSSVVSTSNSDIITIQIGTLDLNMIKLLRPLANQVSTTYLSILEGAFVDMQNYMQGSNNLTGISNNSAILVYMQIPDSTAPVLVSFDLDMNEPGLVSMTFSEVVDISTFQLAGITFANTSNSLDSFYTLTGGSVIAAGINGKVVNFTLSVSDINNIKSLSVLAIDKNSTFMTIDQVTVKDMQGNNVTAIPVSGALKASNFVSDTTQPTLTSFKFDLNVGVIMLSFSKTVNPSTFQPTHITLQSLVNTSNIAHIQIADYGMVSQSVGPEINITLTLNDLNAIKRVQPFGGTLSAPTTYLVLQTGAVKDVAGNSVVGISNSNAILSSVFVKDTTAPILERFDLNMSSGIVTLWFSETMNAITLLGAKVELTAGSTNQSSVLCVGGISASNDSSTLQLVLPRSVLDAIKLTDAIGMTKSQSFVRLLANAVADMSKNTVEGMMTGLNADDFESDMIRPDLLQFDLDMNASVIRLSFSEVIRALSFDVASVFLRSSFSFPTFEVPLTFGCSSSSILNGDILMIYVCEADANNFKRTVMIGYDQNATYIGLSGLAVKDMQNNDIVPIISRVNTLNLDYVSPKLTSFSLNMSSGYLVLTFDEPVRGSVVAIDAIQLQGASVLSPYSFNLQGTSISNVNDTTIITVISADVLDAIRLTVEVATTISNTFLSLTSNLVVDTFGNNVVSIPTSDAKQAGQFYADELRPTLVSFSFSGSVMFGLYSLSMQLNFSKAVNITSFNASQLSLSNSLASDALFPLTGAKGMPVATNIGRTITFIFSSDDVKNLREVDGLCKQQSNCFLSLPSTTVYDMSHNSVTANKQQAISYIADLVQPYVALLQLNMSAGQLSIIMSEAVNITTFVVTAVTILGSVDAAIGSADAYTLTNSTVAQPQPNQIEITLTDFDLNLIKANGIATMLSSAYVFIAYAFVEDFVYNEAKQFDSTQVNVFIADTVAPVLLSFNVDMTLGQISMTFSEAHDILTLDITKFFFQSQMNSPSFQIAPLDAAESVASTSLTSLTFLLSIVDRNRLRQINGLADATTTTFIRGNGAFIKDLKLNGIAQSTLQVTNFVGDTISPRALAHSLDMTTGFLTVSYNRPIHLNSIVVSDFMLSASNLMPGITLISAETSITNLTSISLKLSLADLNALKANFVCLSIETCFLSYSANSVKSTTENFASQLTIGSALVASSYTRDATQPTVNNTQYQGFTQLDLNTGVVIMQFSETVNTSSFNPAKITLQSSFGNDDPEVFSGITLTGGTVLNNNTPSNVIKFVLNNFDLNLIRADPLVCKARNGCFMTFTSDLLFDMARNDIVPVVSDSTQPTLSLVVSKLVQDKTRPSVVSFDLNMNTGVLSFEFSKSVSVASLVASGITLQSTANDNDALTVKYTLTGSSSPSFDGKFLSVILTRSDVKKIMEINVAKFDSNTYLSLTNMTIKDTSYVANKVETISSTLALPVKTYTRDSTNPLLVEFRLSLTSPVQLLLTFNEPVNAATMNSSGITLQSSESSVVPIVLLTGSIVSPVVVVSNGFVTGRTSITILLNQADSTLLLTSSGVGTNLSNTWLSLSQGAILDMAGNTVDIISATNALQATEFSTPKVFAEVIKFAVLDLQKGLLQLSFNNVINGQSLKIGGIAIQGSQTAIGGNVYVLKTSTTSSTFGYSLTIDLSASDLLGLSKVLNVGRTQSNSFVTVTAASLADTFNNDIVAVTDGKALQVENFIYRTVPPSLISFDVDMSLRTITMYFSDALNTSKFDLSQIVLLSGMSSNYNLTGGNVTWNTAQTELVVKITKHDFNNIMRTDSIGLIDSTLQLRLSSLFGNSLFDVPITSTVLMNVSNLVEDTERPTLFSVRIDLNDSSLVLSFSEVIRVMSIITSYSLTVQNTNSSPAISYVLTSFFVDDKSVSSDSVRVVITFDDMQNISLIQNVMTTIGNSFLSIMENTVSDMSGNGCVANTIPATSVGIDYNLPHLSSITLDFDQGLLFLLFNKAVKSSSLNVTALVAKSTSASYSFKSMDTPIVDSVMLVIHLNNSVLNDLKYMGIMLSNESSFLCSLSSLVSDMYGNKMLPLSCSAPMHVINYKSDVTKPIMTQFDFSLNSTQGILTLHFNEPVNISSLDFSLFSLSGFSGKNITIFESSVVANVETSPEFLVYAVISEAATDYLKLNNICRKVTSCFFSISSKFAVDLSGNGIDLTQGSVSTYVGDFIAPTLVSMNLDINSGYLILVFDEPVNAESMNVTEVELIATP